MSSSSSGSSSSSSSAGLSVPTVTGKSPVVVSSSTASESLLLSIRISREQIDAFLKNVSLSDLLRAQPKPMPNYIKAWIQCNAPASMSELCETVSNASGLFGASYLAGAVISRALEFKGQALSAKARANMEIHSNDVDAFVSLCVSHDHDWYGAPVKEYKTSQSITGSNQKLQLPVDFETIIPPSWWTGTPTAKIPKSQRTAQQIQEGKDKFYNQPRKMENDSVKFAVAPASAPTAVLTPSGGMKTSMVFRPLNVTKKGAALKTAHTVKHDDKTQFNGTDYTCADLYNLLLENETGFLDSITVPDYLEKWITANATRFDKIFNQYVAEFIVDLRAAMVA